MITGKGKGNDRALRYKTHDEQCTTRKGIVSVNNNDNLCLPRALSVVVAHIEKSFLYVKIWNRRVKFKRQGIANYVRMFSAGFPKIALEFSNSIHSNVFLKSTASGFTFTVPKDVMFFLKIMAMEKT